jgi:hypothetical protein
LIYKHDGGKKTYKSANEEEVVTNRDRFFQLDNPYIGLPIMFLVGSFVIFMLLGVGLGKSFGHAFLLWVELIILIGGWGAIAWGGVFVLSDRLSENQLGLLMWTIGIGLIFGWLIVFMCVIAPSLGLPVLCKG